MFLVSIAIMCGGSLLFYAISPPAHTNILIVGLDDRSGDTNNQAIARTDSVMIMGINPRGKVISLMSIPRDVTINSRNFGQLPVNVIVRNAELETPGDGMQELEQSLERAFDIEIHHTVRVDFAGFTDVIDAAGGINIDVPKRIEDRAFPTADGGTTTVIFEPGEQYMDGDTALIYARTRHADDDFQRAGRQQQVINSLIEKIMQPSGIIRTPLVIEALLDHTQTTMTIGHYLQHMPAILLYGHDTDNIEQLVLTRDYLIVNENGRASPNLSKIDPWVAEHLR